MHFKLKLKTYEWWYHVIVFLIFLKYFSEFFGITFNNFQNNFQYFSKYFSKCCKILLEIFLGTRYVSKFSEISLEKVRSISQNLSKFFERFFTFSNIVYKIFQYISQIFIKYFRNSLSEFFFIFSK